MAVRTFSRVDSLPGPLGEARVASTAGGGTALTSTAGLFVIPTGTTHLQLIPRAFSGAVVVKFALTPYLAILKTTDLLATVTDYSENAQDGVAATLVTLSALPTFANGGALYVGSPVPFRGINVTMTANVNGNASVLSVYYWNGSAWTILTNATHGYVDGTINAGCTFGASGQIVWPTLPTTWSRKSLEEICAVDGTNLPITISLRAVSLYWVRLQVSVALSATVTATAMLALARSTLYAELSETLGFETRIAKRLGGHACVEALTDAGAANLIVNAYTDLAGAFA